MKRRANIGFPSFDSVHRLGEFATHSIARFSSRLAALLVVAGDAPASSSRLQGASAHACADRFAGGQHAARIPCYTLARQPENRTLMSPQGTVSLADERVQLRNLGSILRSFCVFFNQRDQIRGQIWLLHEARRPLPGMVGNFG